MNVRNLLLLGIFLVTACQSSSTEEATVTVRMEAGADLARDFFAQPFPLDTRRVDGHYDLRGFPNPADMQLIRTFVDIIEPALDGYGTNAAVYFSFTGDLRYEDAVTDPAASMRGKASVLLLDVDEDSPEYGSFVPVISRFERGEGRYLPRHTLALLPMPGFPLRENTRYAALVLRNHGLGAVEGSLVQAKALSDALADRGTWAETFAPLVEVLPRVDIARRDVVAATVFRTMGISSPIFKARDWLTENGPADYDVTWSGTREVEGTFETVVFQHGKAPYDEPGSGAFRLDENGTPRPAGTESLRFAMRLPSGTPPEDGWPLVIYAHGSGGDYRSGIYPEGYRLSDEGIALVGYDQPYHGTRHPRFPGPQGCTGDCPLLYTFNILNLAAARDGFRQSALDAVQLMRTMLTFRETVGGVEHFFNPDKVYYMGHSQGATNGPMFVAAEPAVKAAVFSGPAGGLTMALLLKTEPLDIPGIFGIVLGDQQGMDLFHPFLNLFQTFVEPVDPLNFARYLGAETRDGQSRDILMTEGLRDAYTPPAQAEAFAIAAGVQPISPVYTTLLGMDLRGLSPMVPEVTGNLVNAAGAAWTGGLLQFPDNGHFSIYCNTTGERAYVGFLVSKVEQGDDPAVIVDFGVRENIVGDTALCGADGGG